MPAWSISALKDFETCPRRYHEVRVQKLWPDDSDHLSTGREVHAALERRAIAGEPLPPAHANVEPFFRALDALPDVRIYAERKIALDTELSEVEWHAPSSWVRTIIDLAVIKEPDALVIDWKTGKKRPDHSQLELGALCLFAVEPSIETVTTTYVWLTAREIDPPRLYRRDQCAQLWTRWRTRVVPLMEAWASGHWPEQPSGLCRAWCPVLTCPHNGKRRG